MPLSYVIRKNTSIPEDSENRYEQIIYQESLIRNIFTRDSRKVLDIIKKLNLGTDAETWIKGLKCRKNPMQEVQANYNGPSEGALRKKVAREELLKIFQKIETTLTFENYFTKLKGFSTVLEKYGAPL